MSRNFLYVGVILQVGAAYVKRKLGAIEHAAKHQEMLRNYLADVISYEHLIIV